jgi:hypothetical protein
MFCDFLDKGFGIWNARNLSIADFLMTAVKEISKC